MMPTRNRTPFLLSVSFSAIGCLLLHLSACRHGDSSAEPFFGKRFQQHFHAGVTVGDLAQMNIDTQALHYSFEIKEGIYAGSTRQGSLRSLDELGGDAYETDTGHARLVVRQNEVIIGAMDTHFFVGVPTQTQPISADMLKGVYNYVHFSPQHLSAERAGYGTVTMQPDGTFLAREGVPTTFKVLSDGTHVPMWDSKKEIRGTYKDLGNGIVELWMKTQKLANVMFRPAANGKLFAVIDFTQATSAAGIGFAQQVDPDTASIVNLNGMYSALVTGEEKSVPGLCMDNVLKIFDPHDINFDANRGSIVRITQNKPWNGLLTGESDPLPDAMGETGRRLRLYGIYSETSQTLYGVIEYLHNQTEPSQIPPAAFIGIKK